mgnify:CR=1 FL=1
MAAKKKKLKQVHPSSLKRLERQMYVATLCQSGCPLNDIFRKTIGKFGVTRRTVSSDITASQTYLQDYFEKEGLLKHIWVGAVDKLRELSQGDGSAAVRACEILIRVSEGPTRVELYQARKEKSQRRAAETRYADSRANMQEVNAKLALKELESDDVSDDMLTMLLGMRTNGAISYKELIRLVASEYESAVSAGQQSKHSLGVLTLMARIAEADPNASGSEKQYFQLPAGMEFDYEADDGDELLEA